MGDCFCEIKKLLENCNKVLFSGTPCQNAALTSFLSKDYEGLYKVAVTCHGVPSPEIYKNYIEEMEKKHGKIQECVYDSFDECNIDKLLEWDNYEIINGQIDELRTESLEWLEKQV